jgi:two-component system response regulator YesN
MRINDESLKKGFSSTVDEIISYIENNYSNPEINLNTLAEEMDLSVSYICAILKKERNETFVKILTDTRMNKAKELLQNPENKIIDIAEKVGFFEPYYFSHTFKKATGYSPKEYRSLCQKE